MTDAADRPIPMGKSPFYETDPFSVMMRRQKGMGMEPEKTDAAALIAEYRDRLDAAEAMTRKKITLAEAFADFCTGCAADADGDVILPGDDGQPHPLVAMALKLANDARQMPSRVSGHTDRQKTPEAVSAARQAPYRLF